MKIKTRNKIRKFLFYSVALTVSIFVGFPLYWMFATSLTPPTMVFDEIPHLIPTTITFENYRELFTTTVFPQYLLNSILVSTGVVLVTTLCSAVSGYVLRHYQIPLKKSLARLILFAYMFPGMLLVIPYYITFKNLGLLDTIWGLILAQTSTTLPFGIWLMWMAFQTIPDRFEECAKILGAGRLRTIFQISMRMILPAGIAVAIYSFSVAWGEYLFASTLTSNFRTVPLGLFMFIERAYIHWGLIQAGSTIAFIVPFILIFIFQKYILAGFSLKGV